MIFEVASSADLTQALKFITGGDTIKLKAGDYTDVKLQNIQFDKPVTITSADSSHPAVLENVSITNASGLTLQGVSIVSDGDNGVSIGNSKNITIDHADISGPSKVTLSGTGVLARNSSDIEVTNSKIHDLGTGLAHLDSSQLNFSGNTFTDIRTDGIHGGGSSYVTIANNSFSDFYRNSGEHPDAIQFWTSNTKTSAHDIVVKDNLIVRGDGGSMQGIFIGDESGGKLPFLNLTITGNTVIGSMYNGIAVSQAKNLTIDNNTVVGYADMKAWIMVKGATGVEVAHNVTSQLSLDATNVNLTKSGNTIVPVTSAATDDVYINSFLKAHAIAAPTTDASASFSDTTTATKAALGIASGAATTTSATTNATTMGGTETYHVVSGSVGTNDDIKGTAGADAISGSTGADTMTGGAGNDLYYVEDSHDKVVEAAGQGVDTVFTSLGTYTLGANVENLNLVGTAKQIGIGNELNNVLRGNSVASSLSGGAGADTLVSTGGTDTLSGGVGHDVFRFEALGSKADVVSDFTRGDDVIDLHPLLGAYHGSNPVADGWVKFQLDASSGTTTVLVDTDGASGPNGFQAVATLTGVKFALVAGTDWLF